MDRVVAFSDPMQSGKNHLLPVCGLVGLCAAAVVAQNPPTYTIGTYAGTGVAGFAGDGGVGSSAQFNQPTSIFLRPNGDLYIADALNYRLRLVNSAESTSTVAGTGRPSAFM